MESATDAAGATERLKKEYLRLRQDIRDNDRRIEAARRKNAAQLRNLHELLHRRSALAHQVCQFAKQFTDAYADQRDSLVDVESLRNLCQMNRDHIRGLTTAIANLQDDQGSGCRQTDDGPDAGVAAGDEKTAPKGGSLAGAADQQLRPKVEFVKLLGRLGCASRNDDDDGKLRRAARSKHPEGDLAAPRHPKHGPDSAAKTKATAPPPGRFERSSTTFYQHPHSAAISPLVYALVLVAALSSVPFFCPRAVWHRMLDKWARAPPSQSPLPPTSPLSVLQRARTFCGQYFNN